MKAKKKYFSSEIVNATTDPNTNNNITDKISNDTNTVGSSFRYFRSSWKCSQTSLNGPVRETQLIQLHISCREH